MEFVILPALRVGQDVLVNTFVFLFIADHVIVIALLPFKRDIVLPGEFGHADFVPANDGCQVLRLRAEFVLWMIG